MRIIPDRHRKRQGERGNAIVQFAFLTPVLVALFLGTWSLGYAGYIYAELEGVVRLGTRYASLITYDASNPSAYTTAVQNMVVYDDPSGKSTTPIVPGLQTSQVNVVLSPATGEPTSVTVSITGYSLPTMWMRTFTLTNKPWLTIPFMGHYVPL